MKTVVKKQLIILIPLIILNIISLFNMYNASLISPVYENAFIKQLIWFILGYLIIFIINKINIKNIFKYSKYLYIFSCLLLLIVLFLGTSTNGAKCWLQIFGFSFQPSELTKLTLSLYLVSIITNAKINSLKDQIKIILKLLLITLIPSILVFLEPDTGAIINYLIILLVCVLFLKLNKWWYIIISIIFTSLVGSFLTLYFFYQDTLINLIGTSFFYRMDRIINFASGSGYQLEQALITIGASSFFGVGINKILLYIPEAPTDFFFAFSIGNYGIFSAILIIISLLLFDIFLLSKINKLKLKKAKIFSYTYFAILIFHQIYNIGMNLGLLPIMGIPLPFLSYGGTNTLINYLFLGIIINLIKNNKIYL